MRRRDWGLDSSSPASLTGHQQRFCARSGAHGEWDFHVISRDAVQDRPRSPQYDNMGAPTFALGVLVFVAAAVAWAQVPSGAALTAPGQVEQTGARRAEPERGNAELVVSRWSGPNCAGADCDANDDGPCDDSKAVATCASDEGVSRAAGHRSRSFDLASQPDYESVGIFERCYGGERNRAAPRRAG